MKWQIKYLANLMLMARSDKTPQDIVDDREFLVLIEIEKKIHASFDDYLEASNASTKRSEPVNHGEELLDARNLNDLFVMALLDSKICEIENDLIQRYIDRSDIADRRVRAIKDEAQVEVRHILADALNGLSFSD